VQEIASKDQRVLRCILHRSQGGKGEGGKEQATHNRMDPPCRDNHRMTLPQINLGDPIHHVTKPSITLYLASGPAFIGNKISRGGAYEEEGLRMGITKLDERLRDDQ
jgi:hypothetical protein